MNRFLFGIGVLALTCFVGCQKDDAPTAQPGKPYDELFVTDNALIQDFLHSHYIEVSDPDGDGDVELSDVLIDSLDATHTVSIWDQQEFPLLSKIVKLHDIEYTVYYLKLDSKGDTDADGDKPCGVDKVLVSYTGNLLDGTQFDIANQATELDLTNTIKGWEYMFPEFRAGVNGISGDGTLTHSDYGTGIMFLPSGLGYYKSSFGNIPEYAPLIFKFNLYGVTYVDHDLDKIQSRYEYGFDENGKLIDSDQDGLPDVFDFDDDNDGYTTKDEIKYIVNGQTLYYDFQSIPLCSDGKKLHLTKACIPN